MHQKLDQYSEASLYSSPSQIRLGSTSIHQKLDQLLKLFNPKKYHTRKMLLKVPKQNRTERLSPQQCEMPEVVAARNHTETKLAKVNIRANKDQHAAVDIDVLWVKRQESCEFAALR